jgi:branched-chain amino acid transport system substrate-binding protein
VALVTADAEFARNPLKGARANAERSGFTVVHEQTYPLDTTDFTPLLNAVAASECDLLFFCSYLADSVGLVRALRAHAFRPKMVGGGMIGPQNTSVKTALGPTLNGVVNYEYWAPVPSMDAPDVQAMLEVYQTRAADSGVDLLGHYMAPLAYAQMQVVAQAVEATRSLDDASLISYARAATFRTVMGDVAFDSGGEWREPRVLQVQFQGIVGHDAHQFKDGLRQVVVAPRAMASGALIYPYALAI